MLSSVPLLRRVILESPYAGTSWPPLLAWWQRRRNVRYARRCVRDSLSRGEAPIASHLLYTQRGILRDHDVTERQWGIDAGLVWGVHADATVVYCDFGISCGMKFGIDMAKRVGRDIEYRYIDRFRHMDSERGRG